MRVISDEKIPIKMWLENIEEGALEQARNLANLPFAFKHIALMPDCHQGYGMPIGGVMATQGVVVPNAVGVDIGCGMLAVETSLSDINKEQLIQVLGEIRETVPVGFKHQKTLKWESWMPDLLKLDTPILIEEWTKAITQIGTLGGGNHFIEIQKSGTGKIWFMIHSGSRNLGFKVAQHYNKLAITLNEKWYSSVSKKHELAFLPLDSNEGQQYLHEMEYCVRFALKNRELMAEQVRAALYSVCPEITFSIPINIAHNYAALEHHFGQNVIVHRKGATRARKGEVGIIPGSQGTPSYIVEGLGNSQSFQSCSHGAGRKMGRKQAKRELSLEQETKKLNDLGILHSIRGVKNLDEAAGAYKDISIVMENQEDLVRAMVELKPLAVVKG